MTSRALQDLSLACLFFIPALFTTPLYLPSLCLLTSPPIQTSIQFWGVNSVPGLILLQDFVLATASARKHCSCKSTHARPSPLFKSLFKCPLVEEGF